MKRSTFLRAGIAASLLGSGTARAQQAYPDKDKPIKLLFPFPVGTSTDTLARAIARGMLDVAGVNVIVESKTGAEGIIGAAAAKAAPPDGYTFFVTSLSTQVLNPHMMANMMSYDPLNDFVPLTGVAMTPLMCNVAANSPYKTVQDLIKAAKDRPGKLNFGTASTFIRLVTESFIKAAGIEAYVVPYPKVNDGLISVIAGDLDMAFVDPSTSAPFYQKGLRPIATTAGSRMAAFPNVPTLKESGLTGFEAIGWFAAYTAAKTPPAVVAVLQDMLEKAMKTKYVADVYQTTGLQPLNLSGEALARFQKAEYDRWGAAVKAANLGPSK